jgi:hypothetical protein
MGGEHDTKPAAATPAAPAGNLVDTKWYVDYNKLAGSYTRAPSRMAEDQLVVEQLKIVPDADGTQILRGGNAAGSGQVLLGVASIPASTGQVSAAVKYSKHSAFQLDVTLEGDTKGKKPTLTPAERKDLAAAKAEMLQQLDPMLQERGDYAAIQAELEAAYADRFADKHLVVKVLPTGAKNSGTSTFTAAAAPYDASHTTKFLVTIDPHQQQDRSTTYTKTVGGESGHGTHDNQSTTVANDTTTTNAHQVVDRVERQVQSTLKTDIEKVFTEIVSGATSTSDANGTDLTRNVTWKLGVEPKKEDKAAKDGDADKKPEKPGLGTKLWGLVKTGASYALNAGGKLLKVGKAALELAGDVWDAVSGRAFFTRESSDGSDDKKSHTSTTSDQQTDQMAETDKISSELASRFTTEHRDDIRTEITAHLGVSLTNASGTDATDKTTTTTSVTGSSTTHDVGELEVTVQGKG